MLFRLIFLLSSFTLLSCAQGKPHSDANQPSDIGGDVSESVSPPAMFPHLENWQKPSAHGAWVVQYGKDACFSCHKPESGKPDSGKPDSVKSSAKEKGTAPACSSCHAIYPHAEGWVEDHGPLIQIQGKTGCATQCHGLDLKGGLSKISCNDCHTTYPHPAAWSLPEQHGKQAEGVGKELCRSCHGSDLKGGRVGVSCYPCHQQQYPHATDWEEQHGAQVLSQGTTSCQTGCHGLDLKGGRSGIACTSCHKIYPHEPGWKNTHPAAVGDYGKKVCQGCHGEDFKKVLNGKNCFSCHQDYPHPEKGVWDAYSGGHGERVQKDHGKGTESCELCHGDDLQTMKAGQSCFSCHPSYPHKKVTTEVWKEYEGHGEFALSHSITECQLCHGANYQGGERKNPSCYQCHVSFPHNKGWLQPSDQEQGHGIYVGLQSSTSCATAQCHGEGLVWSPETSHGPSCDGCHKTYPHIAGWKSGVVHGPTALADVSICKECHTPTLDFASPGFQTCKECHPSYLQHKTAGIEGPGWGTEGGHPQWIPINPVTKKREIVQCQLCHGANYQGGISKQSCQESSCHKSYPHQALTDGTKWLGDAKQPQGHGKYLPLTGDGKKKDASQCQGCHGVDYNTSVGGNSCKGCHANYPHTPNWGDPTQHGVFVLKDLKKDKSSCQQCHGDNLQGGITGKSCFGGACHQAAIAHGNAWGNPAQHGIYVIKNLKSNKTTCQICHGEGLEGGASGKSCFGNGCHQGIITHADEPKSKWLGQPGQPQGHGNYLLENLVDQKQKLVGCQGCHGANYDKLINGKSCRTCHNSYPHTLAINNLKWFENAVQPQGHGQYLPLTPNGKKKDASQCQACHGANYDTLINGQSCKTCHPGYPHSVVGWEQPTQHGNYVLTTLQKDKSSCQSCHGNDLKGGIAGKNCYQAGCHTNFTHQDNQWKEPSQHGLYVIQNLGKNVSSCKVCHGAAFNQMPQGKNCYDCHANYPHKEFKADWSQAPHGQAALTKEGRETCKKCHGATLTGDNINTVSCWGCHTNFPHVGAWTQTTSEEVNPCEADYDECWQTITHLSPHADHFLTQKASGFPKNSSACSTCHGQDYQGGNSKVVCGPGCHDKNISSHVNYPHTVVTNWNPDGFPNPNTPLNAEHGKAYLSGKPGVESSCHLCHTNLGSGPDNKSPSCNSCHKSYPHGEGWAKGVAHGYKLHKSNKMAECKSCHGKGLDQNSVPGGKTCQGCHAAYLQHNLTGLGTGDWGNPKNHGGYYTGPLGGQAACKACHGKPELAVEFTPTDTKSSLTQKSFCYQCHWAYPHIGFDQGVWEPVVTNQCGPPQATNWAHVFYLFDSPLLMTKEGVKPVLGVTPMNSPLWGSAIANTCGGGAAGSCHFDGYRSYNSNGNKDGPCGSYCHGPTKPPAPKLPDCPPTPPVDPCKNDPALCEE